MVTLIGDDDNSDGDDDDTDGDDDNSVGDDDNSWWWRWYYWWWHVDHTDNDDPVLMIMFDAATNDDGNKTLRMRTHPQVPNAQFPHMWSPHETDYSPRRSSPPWKITIFG